MKGVITELCNEIDALETALQSDADFADYMTDFRQFTAHDLLAVLKRAKSTITQVELTPKESPKIQVVKARVTA